MLNSLSTNLYSPPAIQNEMLFVVAKYGVAVPKTIVKNHFPGSTLAPVFCTVKRKDYHYEGQIVALTGPGMPVFDEVTTDFILLNRVWAKSVGCLNIQLQEVIHKASNHLSSYLLSLYGLIYEYVNYVRLLIHDRKSTKVIGSSLWRSIVSRWKEVYHWCAAGIQWYVMSSLWIKFIT